MKRIYIILSILLFVFFLIPKINMTYDGFTFVAMMIATVVGEMIIPIIVWYVLILIFSQNKSLEKDALLAIKLLLLVALISAVTSIGLIFPDFQNLFNR